MATHCGCSNINELKYRYEVALGGALGYEMHLPNTSLEIQEIIRQQIEHYREYEDLILRGDYYSITNPFECNLNAYYYTDKEHSRILLSAIEVYSIKAKHYQLKIPCAHPDAIYLDKISHKTYTGRQLINGIDYYTHVADSISQMWYFVMQ